MKLVTFDDGRVGQVVEDHIVALDVPDMRTYFERGGAEPTGEELALTNVRLRAPIRPKKFIHTAGNYPAHDAEMRRGGFDHPVLPWCVFFQNVDAIIGPGDPIVYPEGLTREVDYEPELAIVIARTGGWFSPEEAAEYVAGYLIFNDISARDIQREEMKSGVLALAKGIETFSPLGPWIVTPDEVGDPRDLAITLRVNGDERMHAHTSDMAVTIPEILSHFSPMGYNAGDIVSTGTPPGAAAFRDDPASLYLKPGDVVEIEIERIGTLRNPVVAWREQHPEPTALAALEGTRA